MLASQKEKKLYKITIMLFLEDTEKDRTHGKLDKSNPTEKQTLCR